jgi:hypothetical protein
VWFIIEFYITQILISTTSRFECISRLIKATGVHAFGGLYDLNPKMLQKMGGKLVHIYLRYLLFCDVTKRRQLPTFRDNPPVST